ncbi:hypothetical protein EMIT0P44_600006 [Pseudomonas sp. IT-P44]
MVSPLRRVPFPNAEKEPKGFSPDVRWLANARHALAPVLLRGPAAIGHPWPCAANPASMPGCPLRRTSTRPSDGADQNQKPKQSKNEAACQPTWLYDRTHSPVGAGLLAIAFVQSIKYVG